MRDGQVLKQFLRAFVGVEQPQLQIEHGLACHTEEEVAWLNDAGVDRADRNLEHTFSFDFAEFMANPCEGRELRPQIEVLAQGMNLRPIIVQRAAVRVRMAHQFESEHVLHFPLLPVDSGNRVREGQELRLLRRHGDAQDDEAVCRVERVNVIQVKQAFVRAPIFSEETHQSRVPEFVKMAAKAGDQFHPGLKINFVRLFGARRTQAFPKALGHVVQNRLQGWQCVHGFPPMMPAARRNSSSKGAGSQTLNNSKPAHQQNHRGPALRRAGVAGAAVRARPRQNSGELPQDAAE